LCVFHSTQYNRVERKKDEAGTVEKSVYNLQPKTSLNTQHTHKISTHVLNSQRSQLTVHR